MDKTKWAELRDRWTVITGGEDRIGKATPEEEKVRKAQIDARDTLEELALSGQVAGNDKPEEQVLSNVIVYRSTMERKLAEVDDFIKTIRLVEEATAPVTPAAP